MMKKMHLNYIVELKNSGPLFTLATSTGSFCGVGLFSRNYDLESMVISLV